MRELKCMYEPAMGGWMEFNQAIEIPDICDIHYESEYYIDDPEMGPIYLYKIHVVDPLGGVNTPEILRFAIPCWDGISFQGE